MYRIIAYDEPTAKNGYTVFDPRINVHLLAGKLTLKEQDINDLSLTVNQSNPLFDNVRPMHTHVEVYEDNDLIFRGRAIKPQREMNSNGAFSREYTFESIEAYLLDSIQRFYVAVGQSPKEFLQTLIDVHNDQVPDYKKFDVKNVDVDNSADNEYRQIDYPNTRDAIKEHLLERLGGYLTVHYNKDGRNTLDYTKTIGTDHKNDTPIEIGVNMESAKLLIDPTKVITRVIPLGAQIKSQDVELGDDNTTNWENIPGGGGATTAINGDWTPAINHAAQLMGVTLDQNSLNTILRRIQQESGGSETVQNNWDSNAAAGTPSIGLLQYIQPTFNYWAVQGHTNIRSGFDQLLAMFNDSNWLRDISRPGGWGPTGTRRVNGPISEPSQTVSTTQNTWGWPFPGSGDRPFSQAQSFGYDGGYRINSFHDGLDFGSNTHPGNPIHAIHGGTVIIKSYMNGLGNYMVTHSKDGYNIVYQEAFSSPGNIWKNVGDVVKTGDEIGQRTTDHLHVGVTKADFYAAVRKSFTNDGTWLDPAKLIREGGQEGDKTSNSTKYTNSGDGPKPRVTIASVNEGRDYIDVPELQKEFDVINGKIEFNDIEDPSQLFEAAKAWIKSQNAASFSWEISALELPNFKHFKVADRYMFVNPYVANPQLLRVVEKQIDFINPHKSELTISPQDVSLSGYQVEQSRTIDQRLQLLNRQVRRQGTVIVNNGNALGDVQQVITSGGTADTQRYDQINFHLKNLQTAVDDLPQKYVSIEDYNKLKKAVEELQQKGSDNSGN